MRPLSFWTHVLLVAFGVYAKEPTTPATIELTSKMSVREVTFIEDGAAILRG